MLLFLLWLLNDFEKFFISWNLKALCYESHQSVSLMSKLYLITVWNEMEKGGKLEDFSCSNESGSLNASRWGVRTGNTKKASGL